MSKNKIVKEWTINAHWGEIAMVSWGSSENPPVLLVHGYMDSVATFNLLVELLPDTYYYVGFDLPGHGKSDHFPPGPLISHTHLTEAIRIVVDHMNWKKFIYLGHSIAFIFGTFYNNIFPGKIEKMINIDPYPALPWIYFTTYDPSFWFQYFCIEYYSNYERYTSDPPKLYTYDDAISTVAMSRSITKQQAEVVLSRTLVPVEKGLYKFSWDPRMIKTASALVPEDTLFLTITTNAPPMLNIFASEREIVHTEMNEKLAAKMMNKLRRAIPCYSEVSVKGGHDVHIINPEGVADEIVYFLNRDLTTTLKAKL